MTKEWDKKFKHLFTVSAQDITSWLIEGAYFESEASPHLTARSIDADMLYNIRVEQLPCMLHIEFQRRSDSRMARRLQEYNLLAMRQFDQVVYSCVIYLVQDRQVAEAPYIVKGPNGRLIHHFDFTVIKLWEIPTRELKEKKLPGLLPLLPLTREGRDLQVVEDVITELCPGGQVVNNDLVSLTCGIAALVFTDEQDQIWLKRRFAMLEDILQESWAVQEWIKQGEERGLIKGEERGLQKVVKRQQASLLKLVEERFPTLAHLAQKKIPPIDDLDILQALRDRIIEARTEEEARRVFTE